MMSAAGLFRLASFLFTLAELGIKGGAAKKLVTSDGRTEEVEAVFDDGVGRKAAFKKTADGKGSRIIVDSKGLSASQVKKQHENVNKIVQRYARRNAVEQLKSQGYQVAEEENQADGSIRLLVRKWTS